LKTSDQNGSGQMKGNRLQMGPRKTEKAVAQGVRGEGADTGKKRRSQRRGTTTRGQKKHKRRKAKSQSKSLQQSCKGESSTNHRIADTKTIGKLSKTDHKKYTLLYLEEKRSNGGEMPSLRQQRIGNRKGKKRKCAHGPNPRIGGVPIKKKLGITVILGGGKKNKQKTEGDP